MNQQHMGLANKIYQEMKNNIDIIRYWFEKEGEELDEVRLFKYEKCDFSPILENETIIYTFVNKMINNVMYGKQFQVGNLNYIESNFIALLNIVTDEYNNSYIKGDGINEYN